MTSPADTPPDIEAQLQAHLTNALISYRGGDPARGRRSLRRAVLLGQPEGYRLPFIQDWAWIQSALRHDPDLASTCRPIAPPGQLVRDDQPAGPADAAPRSPAPRA